ncbi:MAG: hypothetical protein WAK90_14415, partial [Pseudolabrys sp.]
SGTICESRAGLRLVCLWPAFALVDRNSVNGLALLELRISQLQSCATALKGRLWPVFPAHG